MSFEALGIPVDLIRTLENENYKKPFPIQEQAIPAILAKKDLLGIAPTGSGKTASYVIPILMNLQRSDIRENRHIKTLVLVPTRELAQQVREVFHLFSFALPKSTKSMAVFGGVSINPQMIGMQGVKVLVATPGRLLDLVNSKALHFSELETLVLDEADKMLNLGFKQEMEKIISLLPARRQNLLFSATLSPQVENIREIILKKPLVINIEPKEDHIDKIHQHGFFVEADKKGQLLRHLIKSKEMQQVLVFTASTYQADHVTSKLLKNGLNARAIHGKKSQHARTVALKDFKSGKLRILVATDLLARGVDIEFLPFVINYELPRSPKDYIHRIGRTGRAEAAGEAISFVAQEHMAHFKMILKKTKTWMDMVKFEDIKMP